MKKIGFIDYYISEWHALEYPAWIEEVCKREGLDYKVCYAYAEKEVSLYDGRTTAQYCEQFGLTECKTIEELCEKSDVILILAPSDPEKHLLYAEKALKYGKRTYIDKTFAPNLAEAQKTVELAKKYKTPFFSTSALRYADELKELKGVKNLIITGGGSNLPEYSVHMLEMAVMLLKDKVSAVSARCQGVRCISELKTESGRSATLIYSPELPFTVSAELEGGKTVYKPISSEFFKGLIADILRFYESGEPSFELSELLEVMHARELLINAFNAAK